VSRSGPELDWGELLRTWDAQQEAFHPDREERFTAMFDLLEATQGRRFVALDLGAGPGSLSQRLLRRFPSARSVAVDYDPVVLRVGQGALGSVGGRLTWVDAKLGAPGWIDRLPRRKFDAAVSTSALHWLKVRDLRRLYRDLRRVLRPGATFLNGDYLAWGRTQPHLDQLAHSVQKVRTRQRGSRGGRQAWAKWWADAKKLAPLAEPFREQRARHSTHPQHGAYTVDVHARALRAAGFRDVAVIWRNIGNLILYAVR
jgi:SAM-dependent methyltransferase